MIADVKIIAIDIKVGLKLAPVLQRSVVQQKVPVEPTLLSVHEESQDFVYDFTPSTSTT